MKPLFLKKSLWNAVEGEQFTGLPIEVIMGHAVVSRAETDSDTETL